ncbi:MAG: histidine--tRNA ligase [Oligoflexia bacterium]|nr:histidine--tRNA ligase [Oligoflexia bacterium]
MEIRSVKGMNDIFEPQIHIWRHIEDQVRKHFESFCYTEIKTPVVESTTLFSRGVGDSTDIVQKEMYTFEDRNGEKLSLRPEGTAPVVRALLEHQLLNQDPIQRLYYWGPMFRYERPQKGRYRQFHQYGVEYFGSEDAWVGAEVIAMVVKLFEKLKLKGLAVRLGSVGCDQCRPSYKTILSESLKSLHAQLCSDCQNRTQKNPLRVFDCKNESCKKLVGQLPRILDHLCQVCGDHFAKLQGALGEFGVSYRVDSGLVRGLDYYMRTVFEVTSQDLGAQDAVGGGGRYDKLSEDLGGKPVPAVGFAGGIERLAMLLESRQTEFQPKLPLYVVMPDDQGVGTCARLVSELRLLGIRADIDYSGRSMKSQMKRADRSGADYVLILGGQEISKKMAVLRNMKTKAQEEIPLETLVDDLKRRLQ